MTTLPDIQVSDLNSLLQILAQVDTRDKAGVKWIPVELANLVVRDNSAQINRERTWVFVQVGAFVILGQTNVLPPDFMDAHITLGYWSAGPQPLLLRNVNRKWQKHKSWRWK